MNTDTHSSGPTEAKTSEASAIGNRIRHIIVAEDDEEMRTLIALSLRQVGYEVVECRHGVELVDHLKQFSDTGDPSVDLIISDIRMPGVSGLEVLEGLTRENLKPPMILITAFGDSQTHEEAKRLGAVALFDKPFPMDDLMEKVREIVPP